MNRRKIEFKNRNEKFGIEIELTGITRSTASQVVKKVLGGTYEYTTDCYDTRKIHAPDGRVWKIVNDSSIRPEKKALGFSGEYFNTFAENFYRVELVSPILTYDNDIETLQEIVRQLKKAGGFVNKSCGIHVHLDGSKHDAKSIKNFINIIACKNELLYKALEIAPDRETYCKKLDNKLVSEIRTKKPKTLEGIKDIWYASSCNENINSHYHSSRYHLLNLHSFFTRNHTVELRGFNSTLHAGEVRSFVAFALMMNNQALEMKTVKTKDTQTDNAKYAMRAYLERCGMTGEEFKNCRYHLTKALSGSARNRWKTAV